MTYVIKFGGNSIRGRGDLDRLAKEMAQLASDNVKMIVVHGGGPEITEEMERRGLKAKKVAGLRITDCDALEVAADVLMSINGGVVDSLRNAGVNASGMSGCGIIRCIRKPPVRVTDDGNDVLVDLGNVGEAEHVETSVLKKMTDDGVVPVIFPICTGPGGVCLNVNADTAAAAVAAAVGAKEMIQITDVPGILTDVNDPSSKLDHVTLGEIDELIKNGTISGGMIPKTEACRSAIRAGVERVRMVNGKDERILTDIFGSVPHGTLITR